MTRQMMRFSLVIIILSTMVLSACGSSNMVQSIKKESLYDRVMRTGKIRCAYVVYSPDCLKDPNTGKLSGIFIDAVQLIGKKLDLSIEWTEEVGYGTMVEGLQTNRYDIIGSGIWSNANRARICDFSKPFFYSPIYVCVKKGNRTFTDHLDKINSPTVTIATIDGETSQVIAEADFPNAKQLSMPQMTDCSQLLLNVLTGKADVALQEPLAIHLHNQHNPNTIDIIDLNHPVRVFPNCLMFCRGEGEFKAMVDTVLDEAVNSGAIDKIIDKYLPEPSLLYRVALPYQNTSSATRR